VGTFVLEPQPKRKAAEDAAALRLAARKAVTAFDEWHSRTKPRTLAEAMDELRDALH
jgi:hypothetical protein